MFPVDDKVRCVLPKERARESGKDFDCNNVFNILQLEHYRYSFLGLFLESSIQVYHYRPPFPSLTQAIENPPSKNELESLLVICVER